MTEKQSQLIKDALMILNGHGIQNMDVLASIAQEGQRAGSSAVMVQTGPDNFTVYVGDNSVTVTDIERASLLFRVAAGRIQGFIGQPKPPGAEQFV